jgi:hypothetical protein
MGPTGIIPVVGYVVLFLLAAVVVLGYLGGGSGSPMDAYEQGLERIRRALRSLFG